MRPSRKALMVFAVLVLLAAGLVILPAGAAANVCDEGFVRVSATTISVAPTGGDDTANLQCALDLATAMPAATVSLDAGTYRTSFLEVEDFRGVFTGAGRDVTMVVTLPEGLDCVGRLAETGQVHLMTFARGDVTVRDLTIGVGGDTACAEPWFEEVDENGEGLIASDVDVLAFRPALPVAGQCDPPGVQDVAVENVRIVGDVANIGDPLEISTDFWRAIIAGGYGFGPCPDSRSIGSVTITDSIVDGPWAAMLVAWLDDGTARIEGNSIRNVAEGVVTREASNTHMVIANNSFTKVHFWGVVNVSVADLVGDHAYSVEVRNNSIIGVGTADGIGVLDYAREFTGEPMIEMDAVHNRIHLNSTPWRGITAYLAQGGEITDNIVSGLGRAAIALYGDGWEVARNDISRFNPFVSDIWLDPLSSNNYIECPTLGDMVIDEGVGNVLVGCTVFSPLAEPDLLAKSAVPAAPSNEATVGLRR